MDAATKKRLKDHTRHQTGEACTSMITGIRQLRLSVLDLFNTLANTGIDPEKNFQLQNQPQSQNQTATHHPYHYHSHHHHQQHQHQSSNAISRLFNHQAISTVATSHTLCTASNPPPNVQKQLEHKQQADLIQYVDKMISSITNTIRGLDHDVAIMTQNETLMTTGESVHLGMDSSLDKHNLFVDLCSSYKSLSRLHDYSAHCYALLHQQSLKRANKRSDAQMSCQNQQHNAPQQQLQHSSLAAFNPYILKTTPSKIATSIENHLKLCEHLKGTYSQPFGSSTGILQININSVLKAVLLMRGIVIDAVIVKAHHESFSSKASRPGSSASLLAACAYDQSMNISASAASTNQFVNPEVDDIDLWTESKYNVFRRLTHQANAAVLHFQYPAYPEVAVKTFLMAPLFSKRRNIKAYSRTNHRTSRTKFRTRKCPFPKIAGFFCHLDDSHTKFFGKIFIHHRLNWIALDDAEKSYGSTLTPTCSRQHALGAMRGYVSLCLRFAGSFLPAFIHIMIAVDESWP